MWVMTGVGGAILPGERGRSSKEAFPEEVAPQEVEYEMTRSMSKGGGTSRPKDNAYGAQEKELAHFGRLGTAVPWWR